MTWYTLRSRFNGVSRFLSRSSVFIGDKNLDVYYTDKMLAVKYFYGNELTSLLRYKNLYLFRIGKWNATKKNVHVKDFYWLNKFHVSHSICFFIKNYWKRNSFINLGS